MGSDSITITKDLINQGHYIRNLNEIWPGSFDVYIALLANCDDDQREKKVKISFRELERITGFSRSKLMRCVTKLEDSGILKSGENSIGAKKTYYLIKE